MAGMGDIHGFNAMDARSPLSLPRTVALVGLMGAGKSAIGKRLAMRLGRRTCCRPAAAPISIPRRAP